MREILFRGKLKDEERWVYGSLIQLDGETIIFNTDNGSKGTYYVDPETVGEYTELDDVNHKKIFEGDIIRFEISYDDILRSIDYIGKITFSRGNFLVIYKDSFDYEDDERLNDINATCKILGNVFDNPELFKEGQE